ncbi:MAG: tetratricopeptide repeat protein, partial [Alphaproteobacteria bacterium]
MAEGAILSLREAFETAIAMHHDGRLDVAADLCRLVVDQQHDHAGALLMLGNIAATAGRDDEALPLLSRAAAAAPHEPVFHRVLGECLNRLGRFDDATESFRRYVALMPDNAESLFLLGCVLSERGLVTEAVDTFLQALHLAPDDVFILINLGMSFSESGNLGNAAACLERAIALEPDRAEAWGNLANIRILQGRLDEAVTAVQRAIALRPDIAELSASLGNALGTIGRYDEAYAAYRRALELRPSMDFAHSNLILLADFDPAHTVATQQAERRAWYQRVAARLKGPIPPHANGPNPDRRLRVGYVTADFRAHSAAFAFGPVLRHHDRDRFEVVCYSGVMIEDAMTQRFKEQASLWRHTVGVSDEDMAEQIRRDGIDILVDLSGHTI